MPDLAHRQSRKILRVGLMAFVLLSALLIAAYYTLFARDYAVLYENLRESDTSAVTAELDKQGIAYRLDDDGHSISVDKSDIASARVAVAAAELLAGGEVGFELFNDSDIGLSEFSQKMNYLRALQGELTRTIMAMDGIRFTRVHLALPERSIFRDERERPSAAITVQTTDRRPLTPARVQGLQRLVAAAVTGLSAAEVVILDDEGMALSQPPSATVGPSPMSERAAFEQYARIGARSAIADLTGTQAYDIAVSVRALPELPGRTGDGTVATEDGRDRGQVTIAVHSADDLDPEQQERIRSRIASHLALDLGSGDRVEFQTGALPPSHAPRAEAITPPPVMWEEERPPRTHADPTLSIGDRLTSRWVWFAAGLVLVLLWLIWRQRGILSDQERDHFAAMLAEEVENHRSEGRA